MQEDAKRESLLNAAFHDRSFKAVLGTIGTGPIPVRFKDFPADTHVAELASGTARRVTAYRLIQHDLDEAEQALQAIRSLRMLTSGADAGLIFGRC